MTDAMSSLIIQNAILPEFRRGNFSAGIRAGVRDIKDVLLGDAEEVKERARQARGGDLDFWSIVLIVFWLCVVLFILYAIVQSINNAPQAVGGRRRRGGPVVSARKLRRLGRRLVGRRAAAGADGRAAAATSAAAVRRGAGDAAAWPNSVGDLWHEAVFSRGRAAHLRGDRQRRAANVGRDRRCRRRAERRLLLRAAAGRSDRRACSCLGC